MISLLLALTTAPALQQERLPAQTCELTPTGYVCQVQMPSVTIRGVPTGTVVVQGPSTLPPQPPVPEISTAEADRQARLIIRCADASWLSLCLPGDRREARILQEAANARIALRGEVTRLLSENRCEEAVRAALVGGDLALATEARAWECTPSTVSPGPATPETAGTPPPTAS